MKVRFYDEKGRCWHEHVAPEVGNGSLLEYVRRKVCELGYAFATVSDADGMEIVVTEVG